MAFVELIDDEEFAAADREVFGFTPNLNRLFARRPVAYAAWKQLNGSIKETMDLRRYELATVAAAGELRSSYCSLAHGKFLTDLFHTADEVAGLAGAAGPSDEVDAALVEFARKVATDPSRVERADLDRLRDLGLDDHDLFRVVAAVGARCFFATVLDGLGAEPDAQLGALPEPMRQTLTVGRPVAAEPSA